MVCESEAWCFVSAYMLIVMRVCVCVCVCFVCEGLWRVTDFISTRNGIHISKGTEYFESLVIL